MRIGLLAYHAACNFGANLQLLSTVKYLQNAGHEPIVINWVPLDLENYYSGCTPENQQAIHAEFRQRYFNVSPLCRSKRDVIDTIVNCGIKAVIIGSDAVLQHHTKLERLRFSYRHIVDFYNPTSDRLFPNVFWGAFLDSDELKDVKCAILSASSQDSRYMFFTPSTKKSMTRYLSRFSYISVRDEWTQRMISDITGKQILPPVTPDPVFAFNNNASDIIPTKDAILEKYGLSEKYILFSFLNNETVSEDWCLKIIDLCARDSVECVALPFPKGMLFKSPFQKQINLPLSPIEWYALIKYSQGYVGHNMHPIVVSLHNTVPFFSFDNYGIEKLNGLWTYDRSSKIYHILEQAGMLEYRVSSIGRKFLCPDPEFVYRKISSFDAGKTKSFALAYYKNYTLMMDDIMSSISK